ncbi:MAG: hypothetical protein MRY72_01870 [Aquisalinus sp.]|nr:hypothetical protein [Aquisalinus sp.]
MPKLRYGLKAGWLFYFLVISYAYLVGSMTMELWFGGGVNIFASYSNATDPAAMVVDANKVYWSKTSFLFLSLFLFALNFDYRAAAGIGASVWAGSLIFIFGVTPVLMVALLTGIGLIFQQVMRKEVWTN